MARFEKGRAKTGGRVKGSPVTNSLLLKDAALLACQLEGDIDLLGIDLKDKRQRKLLRERYKKLTEEAAERGGLVGYFRWVAREHPTAMMSFLGRLLAFQVKVDAHKTVEYRSVEEVKRDIVMGTNVEIAIAVVPGRRCTPCRWTTSLPRAACARTAACSTISSWRR